MNKLTFLVFSALVFPLALMAQTWDDAKYKAIEAKIVAPKFADKEYDITASGITTASSAKEVQTPSMMPSHNVLRLVVARLSFLLEHGIPVLLP